MQGTFCNEFNDYLEKLSCMNGNIVIVGDFNIDWLNTNGSERKQLCNILETFEFVQNLGAGGFDTIYTTVCIRCDSSNACRLCRLEPSSSINCDVLQHMLKLLYYTSYYNY